MKKVNDEGLIKVIQAYNDKGRATAYDLLHNQYGVKHPYFVMKRIEKNPKFEYDEKNDCYLISEEAQVDDVFMSMDELCAPIASRHTNSPEKPLIESRPAEMEKLIRELLGDRLLELSRYITLESSSRTMIIDQTSLKSAGYRIIIN